MNKQTILSLADGLGLDETKAGLICPFCKGGLNKDKSFVVTRKIDGVLYYCYRAKCSEKGMLLSIDRELLKGPRKNEKIFVPKYYEYDTIPITEEQGEWFNGKYDIRYSELVRAGVRYNPTRGSYVYPIRDFRGYDIGVEDRVYDGSRELKSIHYWFNDAPKIHFTSIMVQQQESITLVEDMLSGIKCARYTPTVVALGTALNQKIEYIRRLTRNLQLYLDRDALSKALGYKRKYGMFFDSISIISTEHDPKDTDSEELKKLLT